MRIEGIIRFGTPNVAWEVNRELRLDPTDGKVKDDPAAMKIWRREYENGWALHT